MQLVALQVEDVALAEQQAVDVAAAVVEHIHAVAVRADGGDAVAQLVVLMLPAVGFLDAGDVVAVVLLDDVADWIVYPAQAGIAVLGLEQAASRVVAEAFLAVRRAALDQAAGVVLDIAGDAAVEAGFGGLEGRCGTGLAFSQASCKLFDHSNQHGAIFVRQFGQQIGYIHGLICWAIASFLYQIGG